MSTLYEGLKFYSYEALKSAVSKYGKENYMEFVVATSVRIKENDLQVKELQYKRIYYKCKFGGKGLSTSKGIRPNQW